MAPHAEETGSSNGNAYAAANGPHAAGPKDLFMVSSPNVQYTDAEISSKYTYRTTSVTKDAAGKFVATPQETVYDFKVDRKVAQGRYDAGRLGWKQRFHRHRWYHCQPPWPRLGDPRGSPVCQLLWLRCHELDHEAGYRCQDRQRTSTSPSTTCLPMVHPNDLVIGGWDISSLNLADAMDRAAGPRAYPQGPGQEGDG